MPRTSAPDEAVGGYCGKAKRPSGAVQTASGLTMWHSSSRNQPYPCDTRLSAFGPTRTIRCGSISAWLQWYFREISLNFPGHTGSLIQFTDASPEVHVVDQPPPAAFEMTLITPDRTVRAS